MQLLKINNRVLFPLCKSHNKLRGKDVKQETWASAVPVPLVKHSQVFNSRLSVSTGQRPAPASKLPAAPLCSHQGHSAPRCYEYLIRYTHLTIFFFLINVNLV